LTKEEKLWVWFSKYIRLRDSDEYGYCRCFTCGRIDLWKYMDCGHGLGRQRKAIKFHEKNNHAQCGKCNLDGGRQDVYKEKVNKLYGPNTWDNLLLQTRKRFTWTDFEFEAMATYYKKEVYRLLIEKGLTL
jgi:hypothetical protein